MICKRCGAEFSDSGFCPMCGAPAVESAADNDVTQAVNAADAVNETAQLDESEEVTVMDGGETTVAARDIDATVAAPVYGGKSSESEEKPQIIQNSLDKKAKKRLSSKKKKILAAVAIALAVVIAFGTVAVGVVAFTPKYKLMLALRNTLLNTKSFEFDIKLSEDYENYDSYDDYWTNIEGWEIKGAIAYGKTTPETSFYVEAANYYDYESVYSYESTDYDSYDYYSGYNTYTVRNTYGGEGERIFYAVSDNGKALAGYVDDTEWYDNYTYDGYYTDDYNGDSRYHGAFLEGDIVELAAYAEENVDDIIREFGVTPSRFRRDFEDVASVELETAIEWAKTVIKSKNINEKVIEEAFNSTLREYFDNFARIEIPEYKEAKKLITDFLMNGLSEDAVEIKDTRIEDGMTKYDIAVDAYEIVRSFEEYVEEHEDLQKFLDDIDPDLIEMIGDIRKSDMPDYLRDDIEFTVGTKNMRIVYFDLDLNLGDDDRTDIYSIEINFTNINKKIDFNGYFSDVEKVAADWKDNCYYISDIDDLDRWI